MSDTTSTEIDILEIKQLIPHRYPFLFVDKVRECTSTSAVGIKNVTCNEPHFQGHFPSQPVMPGVTIVEAMAQTAAIMVGKSLGLVDSGALVYFLTIDNCKFRHVVGPGDVLELHVKVVRGRGKIWKFHGDGIVDGKIVAEADFAAMIVPPEEA
ncbi:MAG: 3-hydroxyacyl-ACP dehydratase FabZ [Proteobacteria bacterium]|nr:3-hydroxyacyl-ACP dehydratase FabZ [Pseudomonadota bacterium]